MGRIPKDLDFENYIKPSTEEGMVNEKKEETHVNNTNNEAK
jgi:hypothetical protein